MNVFYSDVLIHTLKSLKLLKTGSSVWIVTRHRLDEKGIVVRLPTGTAF